MSRDLLPPDIALVQMLEDIATEQARDNAAREQHNCELLEVLREIRDELRGIAIARRP